MTSNGQLYMSLDLRQCLGPYTITGINCEWYSVLQKEKKKKKKKKKKEEFDVISSALNPTYKKALLNITALLICPYSFGNDAITNINYIMCAI